jgi:hypothetical protein
LGLDFQLREEGALFVGGERVAVDFEDAAGFLGGRVSRVLPKRERIDGGHEADVGGLLDEGKAGDVGDREDAVNFLGNQVWIGASDIEEAPRVDP